MFFRSAQDHLTIEGSATYVRKWTSTSWTRWQELIAQLKLPACSGMVVSANSSLMASRRQGAAHLDARPAPFHEYTVGTAVLIGLMARWGTTLKGQARSQACDLLTGFIDAGMENSPCVLLWWCLTTLPAEESAPIAEAANADAKAVRVEQGFLFLRDFIAGLGVARGRALRRRHATKTMMLSR